MLSRADWKARRGSGAGPRAPCADRSCSSWMMNGSSLDGLFVTRARGLPIPRPRLSHRPVHPMAASPRSWARGDCRAHTTVGCRGTSGARSGDAAGMVTGICSSPRSQLRLLYCPHRSAGLALLGAGCWSSLLRTDVRRGPFSGLEEFLLWLILTWRFCIHLWARLHCCESWMSNSNQVKAVWRNRLKSEHFSTSAQALPLR